MADDEEMIARVKPNLEKRLVRALDRAALLDERFGGDEVEVGAAYGRMINGEHPALRRYLIGLVIDVDHWRSSPRTMH